MSSTLGVRWGAVGVLLILCAGPAEGQIGALKNRVKRAVEEAVATGVDRTGGTSAVRASGPVYNDHVLEMTPAVLDRLSAALTAEDADRREVVRLASSVRSEADHEQCMQEVAMSEEGKRLVQEYGARAAAYTANSSDPATREAYQRAQSAMMEHGVKRCGPEPGPFRATELPKLRQRSAAVGRAAGEFTETQYSILKERVVPFCAATTAADGEVRLPGQGKNVFWVYSRAEVEALRPRCAALTTALKASL